MSKNFIALIGSNFSVQALRFAIIVIVARRLGADLFGAYNYIILLIGFGFTFVEFGFRNLAIREISQGRGSKKLLKQIFKIRFVLALVSSFVIGLASYLALRSSQYLWLSLIMSMSLVVDAFLLDFILVCEEKLVAQAVGNVAQALFLCLGVYFFVKNETSLFILGELFFASHLVWVGSFWLSTRAYVAFPEKNTGEDSHLWQTAKSGFPFLVAQFVSGLNWSMDLLLLGQFHFESWLGDYSAALKIIGILVGFINALNAAVQPRLAQKSHDLKSEAVAQIVSNTTRLAWVFVVPTIVGCWLYGTELVHLFFGYKYLKTAALLKPLSLALGIFCLGHSPIHALFVSKNMKTLIRTVLVNGLFSFSVVALILALNHPEFVAWGMVLVQVFYILTAWRVFNFDGFLTFEEWRNLFLPALLMSFPFFFSPLHSDLGKIALSGALYFVGLLLVKIWKRAWFKATLG